MYLNIEPTWLRLPSKDFSTLSIFQSYPIGFFLHPPSKWSTSSRHFVVFGKIPADLQENFLTVFFPLELMYNHWRCLGLASHTPSSFFPPPPPFILSPSPWLMQRSKCTSSCRFLGFARWENLVDALLLKWIKRVDWHKLS